MNYFEKKKLRDPNFFYSYSFTDKGLLFNILWADGRGRALYKYFHDVLVLDSTYLTNRYHILLTRYLYSLSEQVVFAQHLMLCPLVACLLRVSTLICVCCSSRYY